MALNSTRFLFVWFWIIQITLDIFCYSLKRFVIYLFFLRLRYLIFAIVLLMHFIIFTFPLFMGRISRDFSILATLFLGGCLSGVCLGICGGTHLFTNSAVSHVLFSPFAFIFGIATCAKTLCLVEVVFQVPNQDCTIFASASNRWMDRAPTQSVSWLGAVPDKTYVWNIVILSQFRFSALL